jgi:hypothetical protein
MRSYSDIRHAARARNKVIEDGATPDQIGGAELALYKSDGRTAGVRAYFETLELSATAETLTSANEAYVTASAESEAYWAAKAEAAEGEAAEDGDSYTL